MDPRGLYYFCGVCGEIKLGLKLSRMSSRLFIAKSPSLSDLEAFVADLVLQAGNSGLGSPLQILKAKCRYIKSWINMNTFNNLLRGLRCSIVRKSCFL